MLFPSHPTASRCHAWFLKNEPQLTPTQLRILDFVPNPSSHSHDENRKLLPRISAVVYPKEHWPVAKQFWQHSGDGVSSRRAEFCEKAFHDGSMVEGSTVADLGRMKRGPRRYQRNLSRDDNAITGSHAADVEVTDPSAFVEERFGRNLNMQFAARAKLAIRRRIAGSLTADADLHEALQHPEDEDRTRQAHGFSVDDVYLYPCGMSAIFNSHRTLMLARPDQGRTRNSISYGFPYVDTLKVLEKFGPGALFYGYGENKDLDDLERRLESGERFLGLFCEFPGNPLLKTPDLHRIKRLSDKYDFAVVVDETIGNFLNVNVLPFADVVVSSLTKIFSGDSNVMGGAAILNPQGQYYDILKRTLSSPAEQGGYEDNHFEEDSIFLERNSRDFVDRIKRVNVNAEALCQVLLSSPKGAFIYSSFFHVLFLSPERAMLIMCFQSNKSTIPDTLRPAPIMTPAVYPMAAMAASFRAPSTPSPTPSSFTIICKRQRGLHWAQTSPSARPLCCLLTTANWNGPLNMVARRVCCASVSDSRSPRSWRTFSGGLWRQFRRGRG